mmetsp:Transcript_12605/g.27241  ORF Transcript_12605/g.27241 Transcript_12605/m.27241 type:complete len:200 (-) Transcript_12605:927-1526(-)|eukprot:CAMPEP_0202904456 /NCGR_PEP_ID=MMETSP1392-20130828/29433_1 /ASSEMBLY_ACC=CAM_ASM_000868 /TAXON_ID=225041 /ORGANISM="Chlamydomonas chlamydogama, Strain SAG 11-48b" /LENGTH=199 /DNA_ID=CAMNT_0049592069 /DNA_START=230 /DNA_END=829 /DNA_ORIENTATION=+
MAAVNVTRVCPHSDLVPFNTTFSFEIEYECVYQLQDDLEWKMIYVGSAESEKYDQVLDSVLVGPVYAGNYRFVFEGSAPEAGKIPPDDIVGVTVILLTCSYKGKEFIRIGYYVNNEYLEEELRENPPEVPILSKIYRSILADHPRVTRFPIEFDSQAAPDAVGGDPGMAVDGDQQQLPMTMDQQAVASQMQAEVQPMAE